MATGSLPLSITISAENGTVTGWMGKATPPARTRASSLEHFRGVSGAQVSAQKTGANLGHSQR
jgi:hypothetical protein